MNSKLLIFKSMLLVIILFNTVDALTTYYLLQKGIAVEANPIMDAIYQFSPFALIFVKLFFSFSLLIVTVKLKNIDSKLLKLFIIIGFICYTFIAFNNLYLVFKYGF